MERQPNGEQGVLLTNRWANIFYVCDANGDLRAVDVYWGVDSNGRGQNRLGLLLQKIRAELRQ